MTSTREVMAAILYEDGSIALRPLDPDNPWKWLRGGIFAVRHIYGPNWIMTTRYYWRSGVKTNPAARAFVLRAGGSMGHSLYIYGPVVITGLGGNGYRTGIPDPIRDILLTMHRAAAGAVMSDVDSNDDIGQPREGSGEECADDHDDDQ